MKKHVRFFKEHGFNMIYMRSLPRESHVSMPEERTVVLPSPMIFLKNGPKIILAHA
jgi:hypothetical protein